MTSLLTQTHTKTATKASLQPQELLVHNLRLKSEQQLHDSAESETLSVCRSTNTV